MSNTEQHITANSVTAPSGNFGALTTGSIENQNNIRTASLTTTGSVSVGQNVNVNGNIEVVGTILAKGGITFNDIAELDESGDLTVKGLLTCLNGANFGHDTYITAQRVMDSEGLEGIITAHNIKAAKRLVVGDSTFMVKAKEHTLEADTFTAILKKVIADKFALGNGDIEMLRMKDGEFEHVQIDSADMGNVIAENITVGVFTATSDFLTRGLTVDGSAVIKGGLTINGAGRDGAMVVNNHKAIFNQGIEVYCKDGALVETLSIIGTSDTDGTSEAEATAGHYAFNTAIGVRSKFQGDVVVSDADAWFDGGTVYSEHMVITPISTLKQGEDGEEETGGDEGLAGKSKRNVRLKENVSTLEINGSGNGWDAYVDKQLTYHESDTAEERHYVTEEEIQERAKVKYEGPAVDITSKRNALALAKARAAEITSKKKARAYNISQVTRAFNVNDEATYRLDAGGNILVKNLVAENIHASSMVIHDITVDNFKTNNFEMDNVAVIGTIETESGISVAGGTSEFRGTVYDYANVQHKAASTQVFTEQATATFQEGTTLKVADGAAFITDADSAVSLHGDIEIDMAKLILYNSANGRRYRLNMWDAKDEQGDEPGDIAMIFNEESDSDGSSSDSGDGEGGGTLVVTPVSVAGTTRSKATLRSDLEDFQKKLRRI